MRRRTSRKAKVHSRRKLVVIDGSIDHRLVVINEFQSSAAKQSVVNETDANVETSECPRDIPKPKP
jgi:hypothetical protein